MNCTNCEDTGHTFDTLNACHECDLGKPIQYKHDKGELERLLINANTLRVRILTYENGKR